MSAKIGQVDASDLRKLHETFITYGNLDSPYWFVGLEENANPAEKESIDHAVHSQCEAAQRFRNAGQISLNDLTGSGSWTGYQTTWGAYVKLMFAIEQANGQKGGDLFNLSEVNNFQKKYLGELQVPAGMPSGCLMELFDLARNRKLPWPYGELAEREGLSYLKSARSYEKKVEADRAARLLALVDMHKPHFLMGFGTNCMNAVRPLLGEPTEKVPLVVSGETYPIRLLNRGTTTIAFARHPAAHGTSNEYWAKLGVLLTDWQRTRSTLKAA